jgi:hypothetical protein
MVYYYTPIFQATRVCGWLNANLNFDKFINTRSFSVFRSGNYYKIRKTTYGDKTNVLKPLQKNDLISTLCAAYRRIFEKEYFPDDEYFDTKNVTPTGLDLIIEFAVIEKIHQEIVRCSGGGSDSQGPWTAEPWRNKMFKKQFMTDQSEDESLYKANVYMFKDYGHDNNYDNEYCEHDFCLLTEHEKRQWLLSVKSRRAVQCLREDNAHELLFRSSSVELQGGFRASSLKLHGGFRWSGRDDGGVRILVQMEDNKWENVESMKKVVKGVAVDKGCDSEFEMKFVRLDQAVAPNFTGKQIDLWLCTISATQVRKILLSYIRKRVDLEHNGVSENNIQRVSPNEILSRDVATELTKIRASVNAEFAKVFAKLDEKCKLQNKSEKRLKKLILKMTKST